MNKRLVVYSVMPIVIIAIAFGAFNTNVYIDFAIILFHFWFGFEANDLRVRELENKGYVVFDVTSGSNETEAERRFFDKYLMASSLVNNNQVAQVRQNFDSEILASDSAV